MRRWASIAILGLLLWGTVVVIDRRNAGPPSVPSIANSPPTIVVPNASSLSGAELARAYCSTCHMFPEPATLDRQAWRSGALPEMRAWLGLIPPSVERTRDGRPILLTNVFPTQPLLSTQDWNRIVAYYEDSAPVTLGSSRPEAKPETLNTLTQFRPEVLPYLRDIAMVSMVRIDAERKRYLIGDAMTRTLEVMTAGGDHEFTVEFVSGPIDVRLRPEGLDVLLPGRLFPSDQQKGSWLQLTPGAESMDTSKVLDELRRPVDFDFSDLNGDDREDMVLCQFGHRLGRFSWFESLDGGAYREHVLLERSGATAAAARDFNADGLPDILVVMAQAWEGVSLFLNRGAGQFEERKLIEQPPTFGYAGLEVLDWNHDGSWDFITVNGDNGEYEAPVKPYHGLRLYLNDGHGAFAEQWFVPLPGAYQTRARDYDLDGDIDLAAVSYFPDYENAPALGFLYLENQGDDTFARSSFAQSTLGRWICLDAGDIDGDGDEDVILGSLVMGPDTIPLPAAILDKWKNRTPPVILLRNQAR